MQIVHGIPVMELKLVILKPLGSLDQAFAGIPQLYSLIDKIISSFGAVLATGCIALIGYTNTVPQPTDPLTPSVFWMTLALMYVLPIIGWSSGTLFGALLGAVLREKHANAPAQYLRLRGLVPGARYRARETGKIYPADALTDAGASISTSRPP